ncbi:MAG: helix-turn-helix transcriptional regulator [Syntrophaceae bacterium]|nr:helix-turn-helix transcriptional regulator [Syntrophaceae bacterium]
MLPAELGGILAYFYKQNITTSREIGERIKKRRIELPISQEELAEILGVTYQQVQRYENGRNRLNVENIQVVADALSVPVSYFFESHKTSAISEKPTPYLSAEENKLLRYFRKIKINTSKNLVIQIARLAAKSNE